MSHKEDIYIDEVEMQKQHDFIAKCRAITNEFITQNGHPPYAIVNTYGCQQNENDSEKIRGILKEIGYEFTEDKDLADLVLYNTCAVRESAELKVYGNIGALTHYKRRKPSLQIAVCGCMMQQPHIVEAIRKKYRHVDMVFGTHTLYRFGEILYRSLTGNKRVYDVIDIDGKIAEEIPVKRDNKYNAWVTIMYGCNNFCTYCIVPYVRGRERSRKAQSIISEIKNLVADGVKEITLLGQNVNSYGSDLEEGITFPDLVRMVNDIEGDFRVRFMTSHPKDAKKELFQAMAVSDKFAKHLHLPFQSGSDSVLERMNRKYTQSEYIKLIENARELMPEIVVTSDVIVGFPGETEEEFGETINLVKKVNFDLLYTFIYSKRRGTPAEKMENQVSKGDKHRRFDELLNVQNEISRISNQKMIGNVYRVLVEGISKTNEEMKTGRTDGNKAVNFSCSDDLIGTFQNVKILSANTWSLLGEII